MKVENNVISLNDSFDLNRPSIWRRLIFCYTGGEKTILTIPDMSNEEVKKISEVISSTDNQFVWLSLGTSKDDVILINKEHFLFMMSSIMTDEEVRAALKANKK
jgi:hypothetical protein